MTSKIQWTNETWNIITGCTKYSEGCQNCYAARMHKRLTAMGQNKYKEPFDKVVFHKEALTQHKFSRLDTKRKMIFVNSMSDTFHKDITDQQIKDILDECEWNDPNSFQILTKRAERLPDFNYPFNVWLGVTVEHPKYKNRIEYLKKTNAKIKFLSCEPLLADLGELDLSGIDWVIVGGESGCGARAMHPDWVRNIQKQCQTQGVAFFFKQWGEWKSKSTLWNWNGGVKLLNKKDEKKTILMTKSGEIITHEMLVNAGCPNNTMEFKRVGVKNAGCLLDGKEYKEYPKIEQRG